MKKDYKKIHRSVINILKEYGHLIEFIEEPTYEMQLEAVKQRGTSIEYIKNPSFKVQLEAVKQNGYAIEYIEKAKIVQITVIDEQIEKAVRQLQDFIIELANIVNNVKNK